MNSDATDAIGRLVRSGFFEEADILEIVTEEMFEPGEVDIEWAESQIREEFARKSLDEASWPDVTDCDRLDEAFEELSSSGIIALQNAGYTQSDGLDDVSQVYHERGARSSSIEGYCFYHGQDLERAVEGHGLTLAFGAMDGDDGKGVEIGQRIAAVLERHGFKVDWPGTIGKRIDLPGINWQRRRDERSRRGGDAS